MNKILVTINSTETRVAAMGLLHLTDKWIRDNPGKPFSYEITDIENGGIEVTLDEYLSPEEMIAKIRAAIDA